MKSNWIYYALILLAVEKTIQHIFVTLSFYFNWGDIESTVVVLPRVLMIAGGIIAILFAFSLWGLFKKRDWAVNLLAFLALFDIVGEFVAQGTLLIGMTISFLMAVLLLILLLVYRSQLKTGRADDQTLG